MKRLSTKEILAESFKELAETKNIDRITVKEIASNCSYSTATFYRHFKDKYDLIVWDHSRKVAEIMNNISADHPWDLTLAEGAKLFDEYKDYFANLLLHTEGHDAFIIYMTDVNYNALKNHIMNVTGRSELDIMDDMYIKLYVSGTVGISCDWILGKFSVTRDKLAEVYKYSLPEPLKKYFYA